MDLASTLGRRFRVEFLATVISSVTGALLTITLARLLEADSYGLLFLAISVCTTLKLFGKLGIGKSTGRYISTYREKDPDQVPSIFRFGLFLNISVIVIVGGALLITHELVANLIGEPELKPFLLLGVFYVSFSSLNYFARRNLQGFEAFNLTAFAKIIQSVSTLIFVLLLVAIGYGALGAFIGYTFGYMAATVVGLGYLCARYYWGQERVSLEAGLRRRIAEYSLPIAITSTASNIDRHFDTILVGFFIGPAAVAFYTIGKQVISFIETPANSLGFAVSPTYETQRAQGKSKVAATIYEESIKHTLLLYIPASAGLIIVSPPLVELVFGSDYLGAIPVLQVLSLYAIFHAVMKITGSGLDFLGRARIRSILRGGTAILNVILNLILIPTIGVVGAAIATVVTYGIYTLSTVYIMHIELPIKTQLVTRFVVAIVLVTVAMSAVVFVMMQYVTGFGSLLGVICLGVFVWAVLSVSLGLVDYKEVISSLI